MISLRSLYRFPAVRAFSFRYGRSVWKLPLVLRKRLTFEANWRHLPDSKIQYFGQPQKVHPTAPVFAQGGLNFRQKMVLANYRLPQPSVMRLPIAWLVGKHAAPITPEGRLLLSPFRDAPRILSLEQHPDILNFLNSGQFRQKPAIPQRRDIFPLVSRLDPNYFHWIVESCGQLQGLEAYSAATGIKPQILIRAGGNPYIRQSLQLLGYGPQIIEWNQDGSPTPVEGLIIASLPGNRVACSPASLQWLRGKFLAAAGVEMGKIKPTRKIYISRKPGGWRLVANDTAVAAALAENGFETLRPDGLSLAEQIQLFSESKIIVGMHGAGLTNILFTPGAALLEFTGDYGGGEYLSMAASLGNPYASVRCQTRGDDIVVDIANLLGAIKRLSTAAPPQ